MKLIKSGVITVCVSLLFLVFSACGNDEPKNPNDNPGIEFPDDDNPGGGGNQGGSGSTPGGNGDNPGGGNAGGGNTPNMGDDSWTEITTYELDGYTYSMIFVEGTSSIPSFWMMQTEMPTDSYLTVGPAILKLDRNNDYVVIKSEFREFLDELREKTGIAFRLPTRAEWQYAARGGNKSEKYIYSGSNSLDLVGWYGANCNKEPQGVAKKSPNELGFYDMSGNYAELTNDENDLYNVDGAYCGGCYKDKETDCRIISWMPGKTSGKVTGTKFKEKNAYDGHYITIRLVYTAKKNTTNK